MIDIKIRYKIVLMMFLFINIVSAKPPLCISLGHFCETAVHLRLFHIREEAYPFDWIISPFDSLYRCLDENFANFLNHLAIHKGHEITNYYGLRFLHDWPTIRNENFDILESDDGMGTDNFTLVSNWSKYTPLVKAKYLRRIERFQKACLGNQKIFFIRLFDITQPQAIALRDLIERKYPNLDFELIIISSDQMPWNLTKIKNFYMPDVNSSGNATLWREILTEISPELHDFVAKFHP